ncbi:MAG TPA: hypothetical protein VK474_04910, partial [Chthoniobacterales bacterium]|nr:hypothetical protein [Chthoniobacterales bacterium]
DLIEPEPGEKIAASLSAVDHVQMAMSKILQAQGDTGKRAHKGRIHHDAILQIDNEFAVAAIDHLFGEFLQVAAVEEAAFALNPHPNGLAVYSNLYR